MAALGALSLKSSVKSPEAFRTISEVADALDVPQHVLRFWETRFSQIKPVKRAGGRRFYRPEDVDLLRGIRLLLYFEGYTIKGVQKILREKGVRHAAALGRGDAAAAAKPRAGENGYAALATLARVHEDVAETFAQMTKGNGESVAPQPPDDCRASPDARRARLEELLGELHVLKARLVAARG